jgi:sulfite reductase beta subunit-like hemoprotein
MDYARVKAEGLEVDLEKVSREGFEALTPETLYRMKTYGICAQRHPGYHMVRVRIPGGRATAEQVEGLASLIDRCGNGWGHITTRQDVEIHSVRTQDLHRAVGGLALLGLTCRSACGHTVRNVVGCPNAGVCPGEVLDVRPWARAIHDLFVSQAAALNPRMPSRLNVWLSGCPECEPDVRINDIGLRAVESGGKKGFQLWVAGSLASDPKPAERLREFLAPDEVLPACQAIADIYTGNPRGKHGLKGRLKYLVEEWGLEKFAVEFERVLAERKAEMEPVKIPEAKETPATVPTVGDRESAEGIFPQKQPGLRRVVARVPLGEVSADQMRALARLSREFGDGALVFTPQQNAQFHSVPEPKARALVERLRALGLGPEGIGTVVDVQACPGLDFCSLAVTNSQGAGRALTELLIRRGMGMDEELRGFRIHVSGCPNSCAKHQAADIGLSGVMTAVGEDRRFSYTLHLGGSLHGKFRLGSAARKGLTDEMVVPTVEAVLALYREMKAPGEKFPDTLERVGRGEFIRRLEVRIAGVQARPGPSGRVVMVPALG